MYLEFYEPMDAKLLKIINTAYFPVWNDRKDQIIFMAIVCDRFERGRFKFGYAVNVKDKVNTHDVFLARERLGQATKSSFLIVHEVSKALEVIR
ncbi:MAG: hypothetical protein LBF43_02440 [Puniceicoccales bacterium]|jgi:hypothetical protein|nr:hypothetical protein [Puniceicoccales bacterium]